MKDRKRDFVIIEKVLRYCDEIEKTPFEVRFILEKYLNPLLLNEGV